MDNIIKKAILLSLLTTTILFLLSFASSAAFDFLRMDKIGYTYEITQLKADSYILEQELYEINGINPCGLLESRLWELKEKVGELGLDMTIYRGQSIFLKDDFLRWKRKYIQAELHFFTLAQYIQSQCKTDKNIIIFFFKPDHEKSITQGFILQELAREFNDTVAILSFDIEYEDEPVLDHIKLNLNITDEPVMIMPNGTKLFPLSYIGEIKQYIKS
jgi:hypothetical protein